MKIQLLYLSLCLLLINSEVDMPYLVREIQNKVRQKYNVDGSQYMDIISTQHIGTFHYTFYVKYYPNSVFRVDFINSVVTDVEQVKGGQNRFYTIASQVLPHRYTPIKTYTNQQRPRYNESYILRVNYPSYMPVNGSGIPIPIPNGNPVPENPKNKEDDGWPEWLPKPKIPEMPKIPDLFPPAPVPMPMPG